MKKIFMLIVLYHVLFTRLWAQHEADNWYFGLNAGITFSTLPPSALTGSQMSTPEGSASLSDSAGNLLFYSDGSSIWDRNHNVMPNGSGLNGSLTCSQSALFVPFPANDSLYFLFTPPDEFTLPGFFCYSIIDMTLNNGYGDVTNKNTQLFSPSTEKVTAVRHANGSDIWVIGHSYNNADFYAYLITSAGINPAPVISTAGSVHTGGSANKEGIMKASPCGDKIALTVTNDAFVELFDFDNSTGIVSNAIHLGNFMPNNTWPLYGVEFSPGGSRLYVTQEQPAVLVQYNLLAGSPSAIIASADTIKMLSGTSMFTALQTGPDGKIYISRFTAFFLACINNPDSLGTACNFTDTAVTLSSGGAHGLPGFMSSLFCPLTTNLSPPASGDLIFSIHPNPAHEQIQILFDSFSALTAEVTFSDFLGQAIMKKNISMLPHSKQEIIMDVKKLPASMYFVTLKNRGQIITRKFLKQ